MHKETVVNSWTADNSAPLHQMVPSCSQMMPCRISPGERGVPLRQGARAAALRARRLVLRQAVRRAAGLRAPLPAALPPGRLPALRPGGARDLPGAATRPPCTVSKLFNHEHPAWQCGMGRALHIGFRRALSVAPVVSKYHMYLSMRGSEV